MSLFCRRQFVLLATSLAVPLAVPLALFSARAAYAESQRQPNIVVCMADDWSWPHAGILGDPVVKTPHFDRVAAEGVLIENAFVSTPSCTPSRLSILTGQHHWRLREGDSLGGSLREEFATYTELLQQAGYRIGRFGKGVWPSQHRFRKRDSFGPRHASFQDFLKQRKAGQPFCYWHGGQDPHRPYKLDSGKSNGLPIDKLRVPGCLPDHDTIRSDLADYLVEVQRFDREVGDLLKHLEEIGELEHTIVVVSSDNGMPFPRCKATLYDQGTRVPLAIRWGDRLSAGRRVPEMVSLCDLAPTFLEAAGVSIPPQMTGRSLLPLLVPELAAESQAAQPARDFVLVGRERHVYAQPARAIRTREFLYIRNFDPDQWPNGEVAGHNPTYDFASSPWPTEPGAFSFNIDPSPSKQLLRLHRDEASISPFAALAFDPRPVEELYDLSRDPEQLENVATDSRHAAVKLRMKRRLEAELIKSADPRAAVPGYLSRDVEGWPVRVSEALLENQPEKTKRALELLVIQLQKVQDVLPAEALAQVRTVPIWLSMPYDGFRPTGEYHPGAGWLKRQGRDPRLHQCVEFSNVSIFERETKRMPVLVLHELAHAYHDQILGFDHPDIKAAYEKAQESGIYEAVRRNNGRTERSYAMTTPMEYFAESSEAFFGINDFYPFTNSELQKHDPLMFELLGRLWKTKPPQTKPIDP